MAEREDEKWTVSAITLVFESMRRDQLITSSSPSSVKKKIVFGENTLLAEITFKQFFEQIGGPIEIILEKNKDSHEVKYMKRADSKDINKY